MHKEPPFFFVSRPSIVHKTVIDTLSRILYNIFRGHNIPISSNRKEPHYEML